MTVEQIHELGAQRHGFAWSRANQRAVNALTGCDLKPWSPGVKEAVPLVILRILDGIRLDAGEQWLKDVAEWKPKVERALSAEPEKS